MVLLWGLERDRESREERRGRAVERRRDPTQRKSTSGEACIYFNRKVYFFIVLWPFPESLFALWVTLALICFNTHLFSGNFIG